jgi:transposase
MPVGTLCGDGEARIAREPDEVARLTAENAALRAERDRLLVRVSELEAQLEAAKAELVKLTLALRHESERTQRQPAPTEPDAGSSDGAGADRGARRRRGQQRGAPGHGRRSYDHLPTTEVVHRPSPEALVCPSCGYPYAEGPGEERSEELHWEVVLTRVIHRRPRYHRTCSCPGVKGLLTAPPPPKVIAKGRMSAGLLARLVVAKYVVGTPCSRLAKALAMEGAELAPGTLAGLLAALAPLLAPLAAAIRARNAASAVLHVDETSWPVFVVVVDGERRRWWLWVFVGEDSVAYVIRPDRSATVLADHLGVELDDEAPCLPGGPVVVCSDFFSAYQRLGRSVEGFTNSWCWAHMRRHVVAAAKAHPRTCGVWAKQWLERIGELFATHRRLVLAEPGSHDAGVARAELARVVHDIDATRAIEAVDPHTPRAAAKVLATLEREWEGLMVPIAAEGDLDNNSAERALRSPVVGRKNYYGSGAAWSAQLAADAWSITATVALAGWNPLTHLEAYLTACANNGGRPPEGAALLAFLPWGADSADAARFSAPPRSRDP